MSSFGDELQRRALCPSCLGEKRVDTLFERVDRWDADGGYIQGIDEYYVFMCRGCEQIFFCKSSSDSEDREDYYDEYGEHQTDYPWRRSYLPEIPPRAFPRIDFMAFRFTNRRTFELLQDVYTAAENKLNVLAAIGARTVFESVSDSLNIAEELTFRDKLEKLRKDGYIGGQDKGTLETLIDAGGAAAHRGWKPTDEELKTIIEIMNNFVVQSLITPKKKKALSDSIPKKSKK